MVETATVPEESGAAEGRVVAKATVRAATMLGLTQRELARVIGVSEATVSRIAGQEAGLGGKPFELAICLIRIFRSLDAIVGGDRPAMRAWMANPNTDLHAIPRERIRDVAGLVDVLNYLDAARAQL